jgi:peptidoglycan biosynthesis protein MviN/MurJ (putative lipid II flippase)
MRGPVRSTSGTFDRSPAGRAGATAISTATDTDWGRGLDAVVRHKHARAGIALAVAALAMALTSGIQSLLYLGSFGVNGRTDGVFVALALYATFGVFGQSIRVTSVPLLVGDRPRMTPREFAATLAVIAVPALVLTIPLAGLTSQLLAPGLEPADRAVTQDALPLMGTAMVLQLAAAGGATILAVRDRFRSVAGAYGAGALASLATYLALVDSAGELSLGWSMLAMAVVTCSLMCASMRGTRDAVTVPRSGLAELRPNRLLRGASLILGRTLVYLVFNSLYLVTVAFASRHEAGDATILSYAYLFSSYLVVATGFALGMSRIADMTRAALARWRAVLTETVPQGYRYSMLVVAPAVAGLVAFGAPLIGELLPNSFGPAQVDALRVFTALLAPWTAAALIVNLVLPAMFALGHARLVNLLAPAVLLVHLAATAVGGTLLGVYGVALAAFLAPLGFAAALLAIGARDGATGLALELVVDTARFALPAAAAYGGAAAASATLLEGPLQALLAAIVGTALYALTLRLAAPAQLRALTGRLRPLAA